MHQYHIRMVGCGRRELNSSALYGMLQNLFSEFSALKWNSGGVEDRQEKARKTEKRDVETSLLPDMSSDVFLFFFACRAEWTMCPWGHGKECVYLLMSVHSSTIHGTTSRADLMGRNERINVPHPTHRGQASPRGFWAGKGLVGLVETHAVASQGPAGDGKPSALSRPKCRWRRS